MSENKRHKLAYQQRAGLIGTLQSCICTWPLELETTTKSGHSEFCPAERMFARLPVAIVVSVT